MAKISDMSLGITIKKCNECECNLRCEECVFPEQVKRMRQEIAELRKDKYIAAEEIKALNELIEKLTEDIKNFSKTHKAIKIDTIRDFARKFSGKIKNVQLDYQDAERYCCACACDLISCKLFKFADETIAYISERK